MNTSTVDNDINAFAVELLQQTGAIIDWSSHASNGLVLAPPDVAKSLGQSKDSFTIGASADADLPLGLGTEFLPQSGRLLETYVPRVGLFTVPSVVTKKSGIAELVDATFGWQNARVRVRDVVPVVVPYHYWWFHGVFNSDDAWESVTQVCLNGHTLIPTDGIDLLHAIDLREAHTPLIDQKETVAAARCVATRNLIDAGKSFIERAEQRWDRDRRRLKDYYRALRRDLAAPNRRTKSTLSPEDVAAKERIVDLELKRKLLEIDERYAFQLTVSPTAVAEVQLSTVAVDLDVQRKSAVRPYRIYLNPTSRKFERILCDRCHTPHYRLWFTNEDVESRCEGCFHARSNGATLV
jgi:hypothetical protein